ncbi:MAG: type II toxin-antitoxin system RelE/ParE family toxin [Steroidobacteraceae bacterium]
MACGSGLDYICYRITLRALKLIEIRWQGDSRRVAHAFPKCARNALGKELTRIQLGLQPRDGKWLTDVGPGVQEIRITFTKEAYRVIYVVNIGECVYVLHAFHKKAKKEIATLKGELDLARKRYKGLVKSLRRS